MATKQTLSESVQRLLLSATKQYGPDEALAHIEESLTGDEYDAIEAFQEWLKKNDRSFGWNIAEVVKLWEKDQK